MKKMLLAAMVLGFSHFTYAQEDQHQQKQTEEIIIRNKGDKQLNMTVQINGDSITVNGKPLNEFIDSQISIRKRKMMMHNSDQTMTFNFDDNDFAKHMEDLAKHQEELAMQQEKFNKHWDEKNFNKAWKNGKETIRPFLGVTTEKAGNGGVKVVEVSKGSAAEKAGLKEGDIITKVADKQIDDPETLSETVLAQKPKDEVKVYYTRDGKKKNTKATLGQRTEKQSFAYSFNMPEMPESPEMHDQPEMPEPPEAPEFQDRMEQGDFNAMPPHQKKLGIKIQDTEEGKVKVIDVEDSSAASKAGILKDDIITEIDGDKINNTDEARDHLHPEPGKNSYKIKVTRNGSEMNFDVKIPKKLKTANL